MPVMLDVCTPFLGILSLKFSKIDFFVSEFVLLTCPSDFGVFFSTDEQISHAVGKL